MKKRLFYISMILILSFTASMVWGKGIELSFFLGMKEGSPNSDGVTVKWAVEETGKSTEIFNQHWKEQKWSDKFVVDLNKWGSKNIKLILTTDPGPARNTGWDWILIGDAKVENDGKLVYDIGQAVADKKQVNSVVFDGDNKETNGLPNGANCAPDAGPSGGQAKPKSFMQHVPWDGKVGNTIARFDMILPATTASVETASKISTAWGNLKTR